MVHGDGGGEQKRGRKRVKNNSESAKNAKKRWEAGSVLTQNRYALYLPPRAAPSAMHRQTGRTEKAHLHVRFVASMRETQKRLQRTPQKRLRRHPLLRSSSPVRSLPQLSV